MKIRAIALLLVVIGVSSVSSCLPLAAGAAAGYIASDAGYKVQNPITKE